MTAFDRLTGLYQDFHEGVMAPRENASDVGTAFLNKVQALSDHIFDCQITLTTNVSDHKEFYQSLKADLQGLNTPDGARLIKKIEEIQYLGPLLKIESDPKLLVSWLNENQNVVVIKEASDPESVLKAFEAVKQAKRSEPFQYQFDYVISKMVVSALKLEKKTVDEVRSFFTDPELQLKALAHHVGIMELPLHNLPLEEVKRLAPYLHFADFRGFSFKDEKEAQALIESCSHAYALKIDSKIITELKNLPTTLIHLHCSWCAMLKEISISNLRELKSLSCSYTALTALDISNFPLLEEVCCYSCTALTSLTITNSPFLKNLFIWNCNSLVSLSLTNLPMLPNFTFEGLTSLKECYLFNLLSLENMSNCRCNALEVFVLSNLPMLEDVDLRSRDSLTVLSLSNLLSLQKFNCERCPLLREFSLLNVPSLEDINCSECPLLERIISTGLPSCYWLNHNNCPCLRQLPQLPPGGTVISEGSIDFESFEVEPEELNTQALDVLCHLGEVIMRNKRMPNIVYLHSEGLDHGGLRRQLVTTLLKQFKEGVFPLLVTFEEQQAQAFKSLGALIALASLGSLPLGRFLPPGFYSVLRDKDLSRIDSTKPLVKELEEEIYKLALFGDPDWVLDEEVKPVALPIILAAQGFREIMREEDLKKVRELSLAEFIDKVAGEEVTWGSFERLSSYKNDPEGKTKGYFKTFFEKNPGMVVDLIELFTASRALGKEEIQILVDKNLSRESLLLMATCFQHVTIPAYDTYDEFERKLLKTIEFTLGGFGKA